MQNKSFYSIFEWIRPKNSIIKSHTHKYYELVFYSYGSGKTQIADKTYNFSANTYSIIPPNILHNEEHNEDAYVVFLEFSSRYELPSGVFKTKSNTIFKLLNEILREIKEQSFGYETMLDLKIEELVLHLTRLNSQKNYPKNFDYIINHLRSNYHETINLYDYAKMLNISYDYFQHKFKKITGLSPQQFLMNERLLAAEKLLKSGYYSCTQICYRCGFSTSSQFAAIFKNRYGISPSEYKKLNKT